MGILPFNDEQTRTIINLQQHYEVWIEADRALAQLPYGLKWAKRNGKDYLYELIDRAGNGTSRGPRSAETERIFDGYQARKAELTERRARSAVTLEQTCKVYRALDLPLLSSKTAKILRDADRRNFLGSHLVGVGPTAMAAYALAMNGRIDGAPAAADDVDLAWLPVDVPSGAAAQEVTGRVAPARRRASRDRPLPAPLPEQGWLRLGTRVSRVVVARDASPARVVAPDPRWFALWTLWMAEQETRTASQRSTDVKRGTALLAAVHEALPTHALTDPDVLAAMPPDLQPHYDRVATHLTGGAVPTW